VGGDDTLGVEEKMVGMPKESWLFEGFDVRRWPSPHIRYTANATLKTAARASSTTKRGVQTISGIGNPRRQSHTTPAHASPARDRARIAQALLGRGLIVASPPKCRRPCLWGPNGCRSTSSAPTAQH
jgi:hypothetical protein